MLHTQCRPRIVVISRHLGTYSRIAAETKTLSDYARTVFPTVGLPNCDGKMFLLLIFTFTLVARKQQFELFSGRDSVIVVS